MPSKNLPTVIRTPKWRDFSFWKRIAFWTLVTGGGLALLGFIALLIAVYSTKSTLPSLTSSNPRPTAR